MAITNTSIKRLQDYTIDEIDTFNPDQVGSVAMDAQFTPVTNTDRVASYETWATITTTWATETRTWAEMGSIVNNVAVKNLGSYTFDEIGTFSPDQIGDISLERQFSPIKNIAKPL